MKRKVITFFIILICFLLESTVFHKLRFASICPNLMIITTASFGFMRGKKSGMTVGLISGLFVDLFWGGSLGFYMLHIIIPELVYTILATLILYQIILQINRKLEAEEQRSASRFV